MQIGGKIKKVRELKSYTQEYMAEQLKVSQSTYSRFEREDGDMTLSQLKAIATVFNMQIDELLNFSEKNFFVNHGSAHDDSFSVNYNGISNKERELYEKTIKLLEEKVQLLTIGNTSKN